MIFLLCSRRTFLETGYHTRMVQELLRYPVGDDHDLQIGLNRGSRCVRSPADAMVPGHSSNGIMPIWIAGYLYGEDRAESLSTNRIIVRELARSICVLSRSVYLIGMPLHLD